ncbi:hypothetical protein, partial [Nonomuraea zeae]
MAGTLVVALALAGGVLYAGPTMFGSTPPKDGNAARASTSITATGPRTDPPANPQTDTQNGSPTGPPTGSATAAPTPTAITG